MDGARSSEAAAVFRKYVQAFQTLDPRAVVPFYDQPALTITPMGVFALPDGAAVEGMYRQVMKPLPGLGYARTELSPLEEKHLGEDLVVVSGVGVWRTASGEELRRFGMTCTLRRDSQAWRFVVLAVHDPEATETRHA